MQKKEKAKRKEELVRREEEKETGRIKKNNTRWKVPDPK
jgi:hypothetical protein